MEFTRLFDIAYATVDYILSNESLSPHIGISIDYKSINVGIYGDLTVGSIKIDPNNKMVTITGPRIEIPDLIMELYNAKWEDLKVGKWTEPVLKEIMERYPEAFSDYRKLKERALEISRKYNVKLDEKIDSYGYQYTEIIYKIDDVNPKAIKEKIIEGIKILKEHSQASEELELFSNREEAVKTLKHLLDIAKKIIYEVSLNRVVIKLIIVSNYNQPNIISLFPYKQGKDNELDITYLKPGYQIELTIFNNKIKHRLQETGEYIKDDTYTIKTREPLKTYQQLIKHIETIIKEISYY